MNEETWFRSHVERCLQDVWERPVEQDEDGDYLFYTHTGVGYVEIGAGEPTLVIVKVFAAFDVPYSAKLLKEINEINCQLRAGRVQWGSGHVMVVRTVVDEAVSRASLAHASDAAVTAADKIGPMIAAVFGGSVPFESVSDDEVADGESAA